MNRRGGVFGLPVKLAVGIGLGLSLLVFGALLFLILRPDRDRSGAAALDPFHRLLRDYDLMNDPPQDPGELEALSARLDRMERSARGVESWLSLLKRRRALAAASPRMLPPYQASSRRAAEAFPWSEPLAAVAAAALLQGSAPTPEAAAILRGYAALINETSLCPLALGVSILIGDFSGPALAGDRGENLLSAALPLVRPGMIRERGDRLVANLAILRILRGDYRGAEAQILGISRPEIPELRNFLGEYAYDFGNLLQAAAIFSRVAGEGALLRSADALWLGGRAENARNIWLTLGGPYETAPAAPEIRARSLYNLAAAAPTQEERERGFARLSEEGRHNAALAREPAYLYGLAAHSRTLAPYEALALLDAREPGEGPELGALMDLELLRRRGELWTPDRTVAETWVLLGRYPRDGRLYRWAAWYFCRQRRYDEAAILVETAAHQDLRGPWLDLTAGLLDMEAGRLDQAEERLRALEPGKPWQAQANLGLILERRRSPFAALEQYETAAASLADSAAGDPRAASRLQLRIAGCLRTLGRTEESRRALRYSLDLNPDNLAARLELRRLEDL
jgi:tetratricopeptide (TPR) repeat protein